MIVKLDIMSLDVFQSSLPQHRTVLHGYDLDNTDTCKHSEYCSSLLWVSDLHSYPVSMNEVLQFVRDQDHSPFIILQKLEDSFLHQVITEVDVQR